MPEPRQRIIVDGVDFASLVRFPLVFRAASGALRPPRLAVALMAVLVLIAIGRGWDAVRGPSVPGGGFDVRQTEESDLVGQMTMEAALEAWVPREARPPADAVLQPDAVLGLMDEAFAARRERGTAERVAPAFAADRRSVEELLPEPVFRATAEWVVTGFHDVVRGVLAVRPDRVLAAGGRLGRTPQLAWQHDAAFTIVFGLVTAIVLALFGGAICRMAACDFADLPRLRAREALVFAFGNAGRLLFAIVLPPVLVCVLAALLLAPAGLMHLPWLDVVGGLLYGVGVVLAIVLALIIILYAVGAWLLLPAVAAENCDGLDAVQRAFAYVLRKPLPLVGYGLVAIATVAIGYALLAFLGALALEAATGVGRFAGDPAPLAGTGGHEVFEVSGRVPADVQDSTSASITADVIRFWHGLLALLLGAWTFGALGSAATAVYLLLRRAADGQEIDSVWRPGLVPGTLIPVVREAETRADVQAESLVRRRPSRSDDDEADDAPADDTASDRSDDDDDDDDDDGPADESDDEGDDKTAASRSRGGE